MAITFRTSFVSEEGEEIFNSWKIFHNYIKGQFFIDLMATVPIDLILRAVMDQSNPLFELCGIFKLGRIMRLSKIIQYMKSSEDLKASMKVIKMVLFLFIYLHFFTCFWWMLVK